MIRIMTKPPGGALLGLGFSPTLTFAASANLASDVQRETVASDIEKSAMEQTGGTMLTSYLRAREPGALVRAMAAANGEPAVDRPVDEALTAQCDCLVGRVESWAMEQGAPMTTQQLDQAHVACWSDPGAFSEALGQLGVSWFGRSNCQVWYKRPLTWLLAAGAAGALYMVLR